MTLVPPGARAEQLHVHGGRVRVLRGGNPRHPTLLLLHGGGTDSAALSWYLAFGALTADHHVVALDMPGYGGSTDLEPLGTPEAMADLAATVLARLEVRRTVAVGVSMGGDVAMNLALRHPDLVDGLVLVAPGGLVPYLRNGVAHTAAWVATRLPDPVILPLAGLANRFVDTTLHNVVHDPSALPPEVVAEFRREALRPGSPKGFLRYNQATVGRHGMRNNLLPSVGALTPPTLFFHGENDPVVPVEGSRRAAAEMSHARLVTIPDCGHWAQLEAHDRFTEEVRAFLPATRR